MAPFSKASQSLTARQQLMSFIVVSVICISVLFNANITYIKLKEQISLLGGNFIICPKCQVMDLRAFSQVHALSPKNKQTWFSCVKWNMNEYQIIYDTRNMIFFFLDFTALLWNTGIIFGWTDLKCRPLTVPDRMSWGQQFRRWLLQTRSSVNLTLWRVSSPETIQKRPSEKDLTYLLAGARYPVLQYTLQ